MHPLTMGGDSLFYRVTRRSSAQGFRLSNATSVRRKGPCTSHEAPDQPLCGIANRECSVLLPGMIPVFQPPTRGRTRTESQSNPVRERGAWRHCRVRTPHHLLGADFRRRCCDVAHLDAKQEWVSTRSRRETCRHRNFLRVRIV